jgi:DNA repair protein RadC
MCDYNLGVELLAPIVGIEPPMPCDVEGAALKYFDATQAAALTRKLTVAREFMCRDLIRQMHDRPILTNPGVVREWLTTYCANFDQMVFLVLFLDYRQKLISAQEMFRGTINESRVFPRQVVKAALEQNAAAVIVAHNSPAFFKEISQSDKELSPKLKEALALVDVEVLDFFIVAGLETISFVEEGLI